MAKANKMSRSAKIMSWRSAKSDKHYPIDCISDETDTTITTVRAYLRKRFKEEATKLWSVQVKEDAGGVCEIPGCGQINCEAHHLISKGSHLHLRYEKKNGMCLCNNHHYFDPMVSGHFSTASAVNLIDVLRTICSTRWEWFQEHKRDKAYQQIDFEEEYWKLIEKGL